MRRKGPVTEGEAVEIVASVGSRNGSVDDVVLERAVSHLDAGREIEPMAFLIFAMHVNPNSRYAPRITEYAIKTFGIDSHLWADILRTAREGSPLKLMATCARTRAFAHLVRSGTTLLHHDERLSTTHEDLDIPLLAEDSPLVSDALQRFQKIWELRQERLAHMS